MEDHPDQQTLLDLPPRRRRRPTPPERRANDLDGAAWLQNSISVWSDVVKTPEETVLRHPAMFPVRLAARLIESLTRAGQDVVLDPFCGTGSTLLAAESLGKDAIGLDLSERYVAIARSRPSPTVGLFDRAPARRGHRLVIRADARDLADHVAPASVDCVVTSPPYWDILLRERSVDGKDPRHYGDAGPDLGRIADYDEFLDALARVFAGVYDALKPGAYCCAVVMDLRKGDRFYPFHSDLAARLQGVGFVYDDLIIWDRRREYNNLRPLGHPSVFRVNKVHEFILIFQRPRDG